MHISANISKYFDHQGFYLYLNHYHIYFSIMKKTLSFLMAIIYCAVLHAQVIDDSNPAPKCSHLFSQANVPFKIAQQSALMDKYDVRFYWLDISIERTSTNIAGNVTINAVVQNTPLDTFAVELVSQLIVDSAKINGIIRPAIQSTGNVFVVPASSIPIGNNISVQIFYHGTPPSGGFFSGISHANSGSWGNEVVWTLSEPFNANQWWPCKQDLTDKADSSWVFVTTSNDNKVGSNGILTAIDSLPNSKVRYEWKSNYPIDYYLISVAVAKYVDHTTYAHPTGTTDSVMIQNYIYDNPATLPNFQSIIDSTAQMIELYSQLYGMYPFKNEKYGHSMAPLSGGMEHQTMTTLGYFDFALICHELGHMWWGDHVTCASWQDIWLNEGFASYSEYLCRQYLHSWADAQSYMLDEHTSIMSSPGGSVYVPIASLTDENRIFDSRLSYDKGSAIIHMIRFELQNDTTFFQVLKDFQTQYAYSTATGADFKNFLNAHTTVNFDDFFNQWYTGEGYPTYSLVWYQANDTLYFSSTQTTSSAVTPLFKMLMQYKLQSASGDTLILVHQTNNVNTYKIPTHKTITGIVVDPDNWVINKVGTIVAGIEDQNNPVYFSLLPVPCQNQLQVYFPHNLGKSITLTVTDITGRKLLNLATDKIHTSIDTQELPSGIYLLHADDGSNTIVKKFVKN